MNISLRRNLASIDLFRKNNVSIELRVGILQNDKVDTAIDIRCFHLSGRNIVLISNGFSIKKKNFLIFKKCVEEIDLKKDKPILVFEESNRKFFIRRLKEEYGERIDFRYYCYDGKFYDWDRMGIQLRLEEFKKLLFIIKNIYISGDLFLSGIINYNDVSNVKRGVVNKIAAREKSIRKEINTPYYNPFIDEIIGD